MASAHYLGGPGRGQGHADGATRQRHGMGMSLAARGSSAGSWLTSRRLLWLQAVAVLLVIVTACSQSRASTRTNGSPSDRGAGRSDAADASPAPAVVASPIPVASSGSALSTPLRSGEYAVVANRDDHSLSIVPIGQASIAATVPLENAPATVATVAGPDRVFVASADPANQALAVTNLDTMAPLANVDVGSRPDQVISPPGGAFGPLVVVSNATDTIRAFDPTSQVAGPALQLGAGPHAVSMGITRDGLVQRILVANAGDGTISVVGSDVKDVEATIHTGGRPIGVAPASRSG